MSNTKVAIKQSAVPASSSKLVVHKSCYYTDTGIRKVYRGSQAWLPESNAEFLTRFEAGEDVNVMDLERCCALHPIVKIYTSEGKDYEAVITGIIESLPYSTLFKDHGFVSWGAFRAMTGALCDGLKELFDQSLILREDLRLERAELALENRAVNGVKEEVYTQSGKLAGYRTRWSDKLLELHLKALDPEKYAERQNHKVSGMVVSVNLGLRDGTEEPPSKGDFDVYDAEAEEVVAVL